MRCMEEKTPISLESGFPVQLSIGFVWGRGGQCVCTFVSNTLWEPTCLRSYHNVVYVRKMECVGAGGCVCGWVGVCV